MVVDIVVLGDEVGEVEVGEVFFAVGEAVGVGEEDFVLVGQVAVDGGGVGVE